MTYAELALAICNIILWILGVIKEKSDDKRKKKTEIIQSAARAVIDRDATRYSGCMDDIRRMR
jgi:hypothetical protein